MAAYQRAPGSARSGGFADVRGDSYGLVMPRKYREVRADPLEAGWEVVRQRGSHEVWAHPQRPDRVVVAGKDSATVPVGTLGSIRKASGLEHLR
jgi:predicted RNA binding protein YcfA (HicA-like mRNA interferase family)